VTSDGGTEGKDQTEREVAAGREAAAGREDAAERKDEKPAAPAKPAKGRRATGGQQRTGVVPTRAAEDDPRSWGDAESGNDHDAWLKEQKPPHWG
jgi:hypothetical protein